MTRHLRPIAVALLLAAALTGCNSLEDSTEDPPPAGERFPGAEAPAPQPT